jgi:hypothetical protein
MKRLMKFASILGILALVLSMSLIAPNFAQAGQLASIQVLLKATNSETGNNIVDASAAVPYVFVKFDPATAVNDNDGIKINFETDFDISDVVNGDVAVTQTGGNPTKGTAAVSGQNLQIPITTEGTVPGNAITVNIANSHITTPTAGGSYTITIETYDLGDDNAFGGAGADADTLEDAGAALLIIGDAGDYEVTITGTVEPTLSLTLSSNACALGTLVSTAINTCSYTTTVATNATGGYTSYIRATDGLISGANEIDTGTTVDEATEAYGVATDGTSNVDIQEGITCPVSGLTDAVTTTALIDNDDMSLASSTTPESGDAVIVCHAASITAVTPAGNYTQTVTITAIGNF